MGCARDVASESFHDCRHCVSRSRATGQRICGTSNRSPGALHNCGRLGRCGLPRPGPWDEAPDTLNVRCLAASSCSCLCLPGGQPGRPRGPHRLDSALATLLRREGGHRGLLWRLRVGATRGRGRLRGDLRHWHIVALCFAKDIGETHSAVRLCVPTPRPTCLRSVRRVQLQAAPAGRKGCRAPREYCLRGSSAVIFIRVEQDPVRVVPVLPRRGLAQRMRRGQVLDLRLGEGPLSGLRRPSRGSSVPSGRFGKPPFLARMHDRLKPLPMPLQVLARRQLAPTSGTQQLTVGCGAKVRSADAGLSAVDGCVPSPPRSRGTGISRGVLGPGASTPARPVAKRWQGRGGGGATGRTAWCGGCEADAPARLGQRRGHGGGVVHRSGRGVQAPHVRKPLLGARVGEAGEH